MLILTKEQVARIHSVLELIGDINAVSIEQDNNMVIRVKHEVAPYPHWLIYTNGHATTYSPKECDYHFS